MITTKLRIAGVALATSLFVASAGVFAYQEGATKKEEAAPGKAAFAPKAALSRAPSPRSQKLAWYAKQITMHAAVAAFDQEAGRFQEAAEHTETVQRLSHEWNWMVRHFDAERFPDSAYEPPNNPPSTYDFFPPESSNALPRTDVEDVYEAADTPISRTVAIYEGALKSPKATGEKLSKSAAPSEAHVMYRIARVEQKLDEVLRALSGLKPARDDASRLRPPTREGESPRNNAIGVPPEGGPKRDETSLQKY
jgi:hypothetical protein